MTVGYGVTNPITTHVIALTSYHQTLQDAATGFETAAVETVHLAQDAGNAYLAYNSMVLNLLGVTGVYTRPAAR